MVVKIKAPVRTLSNLLAGKQRCDIAMLDGEKNMLRASHVSWIGRICYVVTMGGDWIRATHIRAVDTRRISRRDLMMAGIKATTL